VHQTENAANAAALPSTELGLRNLTTTTSSDATKSLNALTAAPLNGGRVFKNCEIAVHEISGVYPQSGRAANTSTTQ
jgi:hypothetical protein